MNTGGERKIKSGYPDAARKLGEYLHLRRAPERPRVLRGVSICPGVYGIWVHWIDRHSAPCLGAECEYCEARAGCRWKGYLPVYSTDEHRVVLWEITERAWRDIAEPCRGPHGLTGMQLVYGRIAGGRASPCTITVGSRTGIPGGLPTLAVGQVEHSIVRVLFGRFFRAAEEVLVEKGIWVDGPTGLA
jgi:hypothetical protein